jgi:hypothetical protein
MTETLNVLDAKTGKRIGSVEVIRANPANPKDVDLLNAMLRDGTLTPPIEASMPDTEPVVK